MEVEDESAPSELKIDFSTANNHLQYQHSATKVAFYSMACEAPLSGVKRGDLWLGDRDSCSMVQLKHRNIENVIIAEEDMYGLAREEGVKYCKIDPFTNDRICLDVAERYANKVLNAGRDVLICCQTGLGRSASVVVYLLMKRNNWQLSQAYKCLEQMRPGASVASKTSGFRPELINKLLLEERRLHGEAESAEAAADGRSETEYVPSLLLQGRKIIYS